MKATRQFIPLVGAVIALLLLFRVWVPNLLASDNLLDLVQQISVNAIIAFGMTLVILIGGIDLSVGAVLALVGTTTAFMLSRSPGATGVGAAAMGCGVGLLVSLGLGAFNGLCASRTRMPAFIITLATMQVARGLALGYNEGRPMAIPDHQTAFLALGNGRIMGAMPAPVIIMLIAFAATTLLLHRTRFGQHLYAMGGNREAARYTGIPLVRTELIVYMICALLAGVAGLVHTSQLYSAEPASGIGFELNAIAAVVVGGTSFSGGVGTMPGTLIGAILIGVLDKGLNQAGVHFSLQYMIKGLVILIAVYLDTRRRNR